MSAVLSPVNNVLPVYISLLCIFETICGDLFDRIASLLPAVGVAYLSLPRWPKPALFATHLSGSPNGSSSHKTSLSRDSTFSLLAVLAIAPLRTRILASVRDSWKGLTVARAEFASLAPWR